MTKIFEKINFCLICFLEIFIYFNFESQKLESTFRKVFLLMDITYIYKFGDQIYYASIFALDVALKVL